MKKSVFKALSAVGIATLLFGCGAQGSTVPTSSSAQLRMHRASGSEQEYLYVAEHNWYTGVGQTQIFSLPSGKVVGVISNFGTMCEDTVGNVYIVSQPTVTSAPSSISKYAPASTTATEQVTFPSGVYGTDCSIDSTTGKIAVSGVSHPSSSTYLSWLGIYSKLSRKPKLYSNTLMDYFGWCGYDGSGNLYLNGFGSPNHYPPMATELPKSATTFSDFKKPSYLVDGPIQWDGSYITSGLGRSAGKKQPRIIYQLTVSGSSVNVAGEVYLNHFGGFQPQYFSIQRGMVAEAFGKPQVRNTIGLWHYPQGGSKPYMVFKGLEPINYPLIDITYSK